MKRTREVLWDTLRKNRPLIVFFVVMTLLNGAVFGLYGIITEAFAYSEVLLFAVLSVQLSIEFRLELKRAADRKNRVDSVLTAHCQTPEDGNLSDRDYGEMINALENEIVRLRTEFDEGRQGDDDYYTAWVHQIKTPIAVMKLTLTEDTEENRLLLSELFRIERYVEMVLSYVRLKSETNDLVIKEYLTDEIVRETLRKFAPQFIERKLKLNYEPAGGSVITDKKWLSFILEQLISNAVKYTPSGEITVLADGYRIRVSDTGIGIAPEDLPRIFEKGYTGFNGRLGQKSSGLGLFLTMKAVKLLGADIKCSSTPGRGSEFTVILPQKIS